MTLPKTGLFGVMRNPKSNVPPRRAALFYSIAGPRPVNTT
jgi:hypothetical protein